MIDFQNYLPMITGAVGGATTAGIFKGPIQTLQDWWYIKFGHHLSEEAALLRAKQEMNIENFKKDMLSEVDQIPIENIQEPKLKILGPALEASSFYIEEEELRKMFSKVIAASLDNRKNETMHSSFIEIIKQLDVLDAKLLSFFKSSGASVHSPFPIMQMDEKTDTGKRVVIPLIFLTEEFYDFQLNAASLNNLERLGIISIKTDTWLSDDSAYSFIKNQPAIKDLLEKHPEMTIEKMCFYLTTFGQNFIDVCVV